jgi:hypothetical protein
MRVDLGATACLQRDITMTAGIPDSSGRCFNVPRTITSTQRPVLLPGLVGSLSVVDAHLRCSKIHLDGRHVIPLRFTGRLGGHLGGGRTVLASLKALFDELVGDIGVDADARTPRWLPASPPMSLRAANSLPDDDRGTVMYQSHDVRKDPGGRQAQPGSETVSWSQIEGSFHHPAQAGTPIRAVPRLVLASEQRRRCEIG